MGLWNRHALSVLLADLMRFSISFDDPEDVLWKDGYPITVSVQKIGKGLFSVAVKSAGIPDPLAVNDFETGELWDYLDVTEFLVDLLTKANQLQLLSRR